MNEDVPDSTILLYVQRENRRGCKLYHNFMQSQRPDIVKAKHILGLL